MKIRKKFLTLIARGLLLTPCVATAQQPEKTYRVAQILSTSPVAMMAGPVPAHPFPRAFLEGLRERGYVEG